METIKKTPDHERQYVYEIGMLARHPSKDLKILLANLEIDADVSRVAGQARSTPQGERLSGVYRNSFWSWYRRIEGDRDFMKTVRSLVDDLEPHKAILKDLVKDGGNASIVVRLSNHANIGSSLSFEDLRRLADLSIDLGVEVFPRFE